LKAVTLTFVAEGMHFVPGSRSSVRYSIYSGDPDGYFNIDPVAGTIRTASALDHEAHQSVLLNVQAMSGDPPTYGHTQVSG
jgi:protocadherin-16/23